MARTGWLVVTAVGWIAVAGSGCGGETFAASQNSGGTGGTQSTTTGGGGQGGTGTGGTGAAGGTGAVGGTGGSGGAPACQPLSDPCAQCTYGACQDLYCGCYGNQDCVLLVACEQDCILQNPGDAAAQQDCQQVCLGVEGAKDHISATFILGDCAATSCGGDCPGVAPLDGCTKCLFTSCDDQMNACLTGADCTDILMCVQTNNCADVTCLSNCEAEHPNDAPWSAVKSCLFQSCFAACTG